MRIKNQFLNEFINHLFLLLSFVIFFSCEPYLIYQTRENIGYQLNERCSQGPFDINIKTIGAKWGEKIEVSIYSKHKVKVRYIIKTNNNKQLRQGSYGTYSDNQSCLIRNETNENTNIILDDDTNKTNFSNQIITQENEITSEFKSRKIELKKVNLPAAYLENNYLKFIDLNWKNNDYEKIAIKGGIYINITLWSVEPNDFEDAIFIVKHGIEMPNVSEKRWIQYLKQKESRQVEQQIENEDEHNISMDEIHYRSKKRTDFCNSHHDSNSCWGKKELKSINHGSAPVLYGGKGGDNPVLKMNEPNSPPPSPRDEIRPPIPSINAQWISGYWIWNGFNWGWICGQWRVPELDITKGLTVQAPHPPPANLNQEEIPPSPSPDAIWTAGYWQWDGQIYVWIKGSWQIPPSKRHIWNKATWRVTPSKSIFIPGGWVITVE